VVSKLNRKSLTWFAGKWTGGESELDEIFRVINRAWSEYEVKLVRKGMVCFDTDFDSLQKFDESRKRREGN